MASRPTKHSVKYKGVVYEAVAPPSVVKFKGATYDVVALPPVIHFNGALYEPVDLDQLKVAADDPGSILETLRDAKDPAGGAKAPKSRVPEVDPFDVKPEPQEGDYPDLPPLTGVEDVAKALEPFLGHLYSEVNATLDKHGITKSGEVALEADEADGVDMQVAIAAGAFSALSNTKLTFDYKVDLPQKDLDKLDKRIPGASEQGFAGNLLLNLNSLGKGTTTLQEVVFYFCKHGFASDTKTMAPLLTAVGTIQKSKAHAGPLIEIPVEKASDFDKLEWAKEVFKLIIEKDMNQDAGVKLWRKEEWGKVTTMKEVVKGLGIKNILKSNQVSMLNGVLNDLTAQEYAEMIRDVLTPTSGGEQFTLKKGVEDAVKGLTKHEHYVGKVRFGVNDDGSVSAAIDSPYPFQYTFEQLKGGKVKFIDASTEICDFSFSTTTEDHAKKLLTATLDLADAYARTVNPSISENKKEADKDMLFLRIYDLASGKLEEEQQKHEQQQEEDQLQQDNPTPEEATGVNVTEFLKLPIEKQRAIYNTLPADKLVDLTDQLTEEQQNLITNRAASVRDPSSRSSRYFCRKSTTIS